MSDSQVMHLIAYFNFYPHKQVWKMSSAHHIIMEAPPPYCIIQMMKVINHLYNKYKDEGRVSSSYQATNISLRYLEIKRLKKHKEKNREKKKEIQLPSYRSDRGVQLY